MQHIANIDLDHYGYRCDEINTSFSNRFHFLTTCYTFLEFRILTHNLLNVDVSKKILCVIF